MPHSVASSLCGGQLQQKAKPHFARRRLLEEIPRHTGTIRMRMRRNNKKKFLQLRRKQERTSRID
jgi:hypothetical protein